MGWSISIREGKTETEYRIWSSVTDSYITKWIDKKEVINFLFWDKFQKFMWDFLEDAMTFPNGWSKKGENRMIRNEASDDFYTFKIKSLRGRSGNDFENKFIEELDKQGIKIRLTDGKYGFNNIDK